MLLGRIESASGDRDREDAYRQEVRKVASTGIPAEEDTGIGSCCYINGKHGKINRPRVEPFHLFKQTNSTIARRVYALEKCFSL